MSQELAAKRGFLIDLDGTLYHGQNPIEGAARFVAYLKNKRIPYRFVTNNSSSTAEDVANRLTSMGIDATARDVCTSAQAAAAYISEQKRDASVYIVGEHGLRAAAIEAGLRITEEAPDFVLQGIDRSLSYNTVTKAVSLIRDGACSIMTNPDLLLPSDNGLIPGAGSIGAMIKAATGEEPIVIGKPSPILMNYALRDIGLAAKDTWMIGDNLATDIAAGAAAGCGTILVLTGLTTEQNYEAYAEQAGCRPDRIIANLTELLSYIAEEWEGRE